MTNVIIPDDELAALSLADLSNKYGLTREQVRHQRRSRNIDASALSPQPKEQAAVGQANGQTNLKVTREMIATLESQGFRVSKALPHEAIVRLDRQPGTHYKCAVVCCTHLGNVAQQITHLHDFYRYAESKGYEDFWHAGDFTDGPDSMHPAIVHEHWEHTFDRVVDYAVEAYPRPKNGKTRMILGNHDESWMKDRSGGADIGKAIAQRRPDIEYIGRRAADVHIGSGNRPVRIYILHGAGGNSYARSHKIQRIVEGFNPNKRPDILLAGNWHTAAHIPGYIGTDAFMLPSFEHSTPFITSLGKGDSVIGGLLLDIELGQDGLRDVKVEWRLYDVALKGDHPK